MTASQMPGRPRGFTLIELMIVVAILGILVAIAIPQYQLYTGRAQLSDAIDIASAIKTPVGEWYSSKGTFVGASGGAPMFPADIAAGAGKYAASVVTLDGVITVTMNAAGVATCVQGATVTLTPGLPVSSGAPIPWTCTTTAVCKPATC